MSESTSTANVNSDKAALATDHPVLLTAAVICVSIIQLLDITIANVALPHMQSSLGASFESVSWVLTSFIIAQVMATPLVGWLSDRVGSRQVFLWSVVGFILSSMACGAATGLTEMVIFRICQGICAAFIGPMSQTILLDINRPSKHALTMSIWGLAVMVAPITGPTLGGYLTDSISWRWVFYINVPIGIPTLLILFWLLPSRPTLPRSLDKFGAAILAIGLATLQLLLDRGQGQDWLKSKEIVIELVIAGSALWIFAIHMMTTKNPLYPKAIFKTPNFIGIFIFMFVLGVANVGIASILPTMYQTVYGYSAFDTGVLMIPRGMGVFLSMVVVGKVMQKTDARYLVAIGYTIAGIAMWEMAHWTINLGQTPIIWTGFIQGFGLGLIFMPINVAAMSLLLPEHRPDGSSLLNLMRNVGSSFGISALITMLSRNQQTSHSDLTAHITANTLPNIDISTISEQYGDLGNILFMAIDGEINRQALMIAYLDNFYALSFFIFLIAVLPLFLKPIHIQSNEQTIDHM